MCVCVGCWRTPASLPPVIDPTRYQIRWAGPSVQVGEASGLPVCVQVSEVRQALVPQVGDIREIQCIKDKQVRRGVGSPR